MARKKYIFNPQTSEYEEYSTSWQKKLGNVFLYVLSAGSMALIAVFILLQFMGSPKERILNREVEYLNLQFAIMNEKIDEINVLMDEIKDRDDNLYRVILETEPLASSIRQAGFGGSDRYSVLEGYSHSDMVINTAKKLDVLASQISVQLKSFDDVYEMAKNKLEMSSVNNISADHDNPFDLEKTAFYREGDLEFNITTPADTIYENDTIQLSVEFQNGTGHFYAWTPAEYFIDTTSNNPQFIAPEVFDAIESFTLTCQIIDTIIQDTAQGSIVINVLDNLIAEINTDSIATTVNYGEQVPLEAITEGTNPDNFIFNWSPGELMVDSTSHSTQTVQLRASASFTLSVRNIYGDDVYTDAVDIEVIGEDMYAEFSVTDSLICENESTQLSAIVSEGTGNYTYSWSPSVDLDTANIATPTYYPTGIHDMIETMTFVCTITDGVTTIIDSVSVSVMDYLEADAADDSIVADYGERVQLRAFYGNVDTANFNFYWSPGKLVEDSTSFNTYTLPMVDTTMFVLSVSNKLESCVSTDTVNVYVDGVPLYATATINDTILCDDENTQLFVEAFEGTGNYTYRWVPSDMLDYDTIFNPTFTPDSIVYDDIFRFYCEVSDGITTFNTNEVAVAVFKSPNAYFSEDSLTMICSGTEMIFYAPNNNTSSTIFSWSVVDENGQAVQELSSPSLEYVFENEGRFTVSLNASLSEECGGCEDYHSVIIDVIDGPEAEFHLEDTVAACLGEELFFIGPENPEGTSYSWHLIDTAGVVIENTNNIEFEYTCSQLGDFKLYLTATFGEGDDSCSATDSIAINVNEMPDATILYESDVICAGNELIFYAPENTEGTTYMWSVIDSDSTSLAIENPTLDSLVFVFDTIGIHTVALASTLGNCTNTDSISVNILFTPDVMFLEDDVVVCSDIPVEFTAPESNLEGTTYEWIVALADTTTLYETAGEQMSYIFNDSLSYLISLKASYGQGDEICDNEHTISVSVSKTPPAFVDILNAVENDDIINGIHYGDTAIIAANGGTINDDNDNVNYLFHWEPADWFSNPDSIITQTRVPLVEPLPVTLTVTNKDGMCEKIVQDTINIIGDKIIVTDTICDDGASYVNGKYWLYDEEGWDFDFPGRYTGMNQWTFDTENGTEMNVEYDITLLNEFKVSEIGNLNNAEMVYHYGLGYDLYEFNIDNVTGGGTDEVIDGFENAEKAYEWSIQMINGSEDWILNNDESNSTVNVQSEGAALLECFVYSYSLSIDTLETDSIPAIINDTVRISDTVRRWILLYTPGNRPCDEEGPTYLNVNAVSGKRVSVNWQSYADSCIVQYSINEDFSTYEEIITTNKNVVFDNLDFNTTYYWRVASICRADTSNFVEGMPFTTIDVDVNVSIDENFVDNILMYPNPAYDNVTIEGDNIQIIEIYNCVGIRVYKNDDIVDNSTIINTNGMNSGLYIVRIITESDQFCFKRLIIE